MLFLVKILSIQCSTLVQFEILDAIWMSHWTSSCASPSLQICLYHSLSGLATGATRSASGDTGTFRSCAHGPSSLWTSCSGTSSSLRSTVSRSGSGTAPSRTSSRGPTLRCHYRWWEAQRKGLDCECQRLFLKFGLRLPLLITELDVRLPRYGST